MKRGHILIIVLVLMTAVSIFSTGLHANFLSVITGNSFFGDLGFGGKIGEAIGDAQNIYSGKSADEACIRNSECLSKYCLNRKCDKSLATEPCKKSSDCFGDATCSGTCRSQGEYRCIDGECPESRVKGQECKAKTDCYPGQSSRGNSNYHLVCNGATDNKFGVCGLTQGKTCKDQLTGAKKPEYCLSGKCNNNDKCELSPEGGLCGQISDCNSGLICTNNRCKSSQTPSGTGIGNECDRDNQCSGGKKCETLYSARPYSPYGTQKNEAKLLSGRRCIDVLGNCDGALGWKKCDANKSCFKYAAASSSQQKCSPDIRKLSDLMCSTTKPCASGETCLVTGFGAGVKYCMRSFCTSSKDCMTPPYDELGKLMGQLKSAVYCKSLGQGENVCDGKFIKDLKCNVDSDCPGIDHKCLTVGGSKVCTVPASPGASGGGASGTSSSGCTTWKDCNANQYCKQDGTCATDNRQITERDCVGNYQSKIGKGERCKISLAFSTGTDSNLAYFLRDSCTANSQCQLTISGEPIYTYCRNDGFCDARPFADGRGCNTKRKLCAINEDCDRATNKCVARPEELVDLPDAGGGDVEGYSPQNAQMVKLRDAINNAINFLLPRAQAVVREHDISTTGLATAPWSNLLSIRRSPSIAITTQNNNVPAASLSLSEWISAIAGMDGNMKSIEDQICAESSRHPEIETEGLPCSSSLFGG